MSKILVVDDDRDLLEVLKSLLTRKGFEVETDENWESGFSKIDKFQPQLILLDVFLSGIDGLDICRQIKARPQTCDIPVIIFSAFPRTTEPMIYDYGADDFIAKPFEVNDLVVKLHAVLSQQVGLA
ncbi:MAG: response regulator transcription factor [Ginsengibacter sp.]